MQDLERTLRRADGLSSAEARMQRRIADARSRAARLNAQRREAMESFVECNADSLRSLREGAGVPQKRMARVAGVPRAYVSYVETCEIGRVPDTALLRLLKAYSEL